MYVAFYNIFFFVFSVIADDSKWKGRAQQIILLRSKLKVAEDKLKDMTKDNNFISAKKHNDVDRKAMADINAMEKEKHRSMEDVVCKYSELRETYEKEKLKFNATRARMKLNEENQQKLHSQIKTLLV